MPKTKGLASVEVVVLVAVIIIAVAAAWYLYSVFLASTVYNPQVALTSVTYFDNGTIVVVLSIAGPGPVHMRTIEVEVRLVPVGGTLKTREIRAHIGWTPRMATP